MHRQFKPVSQAAARRSPDATADDDQSVAEDGPDRERLLEELRVLRRERDERVRIDELIVRALDLMEANLSTHDLLRELVALVAERTGLEAVGLRLREGEDYPYYQVRGFTEEFVRLERSLCPRGEKPPRDEGGALVLDCACGQVIQGRIDPALPFCTAYGSFWSNSLSALLAERPWLQDQIRGSCARSGYETSALIPLRFGTAALGLLQFEDRRPDRLTPELLSGLERIARHLALALAQRQAVEELRQAGAALEERVRERTASLEREMAERLAVEEALHRSHEDLERQVLARTRELEIKNRESQDFASAASHDLQEPLRKVLAFGQRLRDDYAARLDEPGVDYLQRMEKAARRMRALIDSLLNYSRVSTLAAPFAPVPLGEPAREALIDLERRLEETGGRIEIGRLPVAEVDAAQWRQAFQNLFGNSLKYHGKTPPLIRAWGETIREEDRDMVRLVIEDNGIGFDDQYRERIFQPFQRLHGRSAYEGAGLGLAIVRRIVERHGGRIAAFGRPGQGATFEIVLPARQSPPGPLSDQP